MKLFSKKLKPLNTEESKVSIFDTFQLTNIRTNPKVKRISLSTTSKTLKKSKINNYEEFLSSCDHLQREVNNLTENIEQNISDQQRHSNKHPEKPSIRNEVYYAGIKRIESRMKLKKCSEIKQKLKNLLTFDPPKQEKFITADDLTTRDGVVFMSLNKRDFGKRINQIEICEEENKTKKKGKEKRSDLEKWEVFTGKPGIRKKKCRKSLPDLEKILDTGRKIDVFRKNERLPIIELARLLIGKGINNRNEFASGALKRKSTVFN